MSAAEPSAPECRALVDARAAGNAAAREGERLLTESDQTTADSDQTPREQTARAHLDAASHRDGVADPSGSRGARPRSGTDARDLAMEQRDAAYQQSRGLGGLASDPRSIRAHAAERRVLAGDDRRAAAEDRQPAAQHPATRPSESLEVRRRTRDHPNRPAADQALQKIRDEQSLCGEVRCLTTETHSR
jgi:hypothetical protein